MKCPKCGSEDILIPRCMDCNKECMDCGYLWGENEDVLFIKDKYDDEKYIDATGNIVFAKGGDGTLLKAINKFRHLKKPFFGIAGGTENFLMNDSNHTDVFDNAKIKKFNLIKVSVTRIIGGFVPQAVTEEFQAFNDVMIGGDMNSWIDFNVHDKDKIIGKFKGGGLIISTAQGSTGINKNNNGVILPLSSNMWSITGDKTNRKINYVIEPNRTTINCSSRSSITVWVDGQNHIIKDVEKIEISKGDKVKIIFNDYDSFKRKRRL